MSDRLFCGVCVGTDQQHALWDPCPEDRVTPRRIRLDMMTPAELAIHEAIMAVERAGADPRLTVATSLLSEAQGKVADFVDEASSRHPALQSPHKRTEA